MKYVKALLSFLIFLLVACSNDAVSSHEVVPIAGDVSSSAVTQSSSSREVVERSCSSSVENHSSAEEPSSSSELISSSDESVESSSSSVLQESSSSQIQQIPVEGMLWEDRGVITIVEKYTGDTSELISAGRFWLFKEYVFSSKEREILKQNGIVDYEIGRHKGKELILFKTDSNVHKSYLNRVLSQFYNAIPVNDTTPLSLSVPDYCLSDTLPLLIGCWPDVNVETCFDIVERCGGIDADIGWKMIRDSIQCVGKNRDVRIMEYFEENKVLLE